MARILIVDDEKSVRKTVKLLLEIEGYEVDTTADASTVLEQMKRVAYDVVITDILMPGLTGVELLKQLTESAPDIPVIMMTGAPTLDTAMQAVRAGAFDYQPKPVDRASMLRAVTNAVELSQLRASQRQLAAENREHRENLEQLVAKRTAELQTAIEGTIEAMSVAVESRDPYTAGHQNRVAHLALEITREMGLPTETRRAVYYAGLMHDVGKIGIPSEFLTSPAQLSPEVKALLRMHSEIGYRILLHIHSPWPLATIVWHHHERLDGTGYPQGLAGDAIRTEARILAVADTVEAMATDRPYRSALGIEAALAEIAALPEAGRAEMSGWATEAEVRVAALAATAELADLLNSN